MGEKRKPIIRISAIETEVYNPFGASAEELVAASLDESGLLGDTTTINGTDAWEYLQSYFAKRSSYHEITKLGALLINQGLLSKKDLQRALAMRNADGEARRLGEVMVELGLCSVEEIEKGLDAQLEIREGMKDLELFRKKIDSIKTRLRKYF